MLKDYKQDILLVTGVLGSYANVVEKLHRDLNKHKATLLKIERAGDVLAEAVSDHLLYFITSIPHLSKLLKKNTLILLIKFNNNIPPSMSF